MYISAENFQMTDKSSASQGALWIKNKYLSHLNSWRCQIAVYGSLLIFVMHQFPTAKKNASLILYFVSLRTFIISINLVYFMFSSDLLRHSIQGLGKTFLELYRSDILLKDIRGYSQRSFLSASVEGFAKSGALFKLQ